MSTGWNAFVAMGSNLGYRFQSLRNAIRAIDNNPHLKVLECSPVYENPAVRKPGDTIDQPDFLNCVVHLESFLSPLSLLDVLHEIEAANGRVRTETAWQARELDLDLLLFEGLSFSTKRLTLPHPGLRLRRFVLQPLTDINPHVFIPDPVNKSAIDALHSCDDSTTLNRLDGVLC